jgi:hypothetical protein
MTIDEIIEEMKQRVEQNLPIHPSSWVESAMRINVQADTLDNQLAEYEGIMASYEAELVRDGETASKAKILAKNSIDYVAYLKLKAKIKRIDEQIKLAKRRAMIEQI